jgi:hypothetical protein
VKDERVKVCWLRPDGTIEQGETYVRLARALARCRRYLREDGEHWNIKPRIGRQFICAADRRPPILGPPRHDGWERERNRRGLPRSR